MADNDDLKHSFYLRAIRTGISDGLRTQYTVNDTLPNEFLDLLRQMEHDAEGQPPGDAPPRRSR
jgi:hypothetical protein